VATRAPIQSGVRARLRAGPFSVCESGVHTSRCHPASPRVSIPWRWGPSRESIVLVRLVPLEWHSPGALVCDGAGKRRAMGHRAQRPHGDRRAAEGDSAQRTKSRLDQAGSNAFPLAPRISRFVCPVRRSRFYSVGPAARSRGVVAKQGPVGPNATDAPFSSSKALSPSVGASRHRTSRGFVRRPSVLDVSRRSAEWFGSQA
jgi:hypothetical protein